MTAAKPIDGIMMEASPWIGNQPTRRSESHFPQGASQSQGLADPEPDSVVAEVSTPEWISSAGEGSGT